RADVPAPRRCHGRLHPLPAALGRVVRGLLRGRIRSSGIARRGRRYGAPGPRPGLSQVRAARRHAVVHRLTEVPAESRAAATERLPARPAEAAALIGFTGAQYANGPTRRPASRNALDLCPPPGLPWRPGITVATTPAPGRGRPPKGVGR